LEAPEDVEKFLRGIKLIFKIARTEPLASRLDHDDRNSMLDHQLYLKSDEELKEIIKDRVETLYHPASTCRMARLQDDGVVDSHLRVYGIQGLRVCDASVFPSIVSGHTVSQNLSASYFV
jgi:choline dehydrogenase